MWMQARNALLTAVCCATLLSSTAFALVGKVSNGGWSNLKGAVEDSSFPTHFNWNAENAVMGIEGKSCLMQNVAAANFISYAPGKRRTEKEFAPSPCGLARNIKAELCSSLLTSPVLSIPFSLNAVDAVAKGRFFSNTVDNLSPTGQYGITICSKRSCVFRRLRHANALDALSIKLIEVSEDERSFYEDCSSRAMSKVCEPILGKGHYAGPYGKLLNVADRQVINQQPCPLSRLHLDQLSLHGFGLGLHGICLTTSVTCQARQIDDCAFEIGRVSGVPVSEVGHDERPYPDEARKPFIDREAIKKTSGAILAVLVTIYGAVGFALIIGAVDGREFGLARRDRVLCAVCSVALFGVASFVLSQWAAPLLQGF